MGCCFPVGRQSISSHAAPVGERDSKVRVRAEAPRQGDHVGIQDPYVAAQSVLVQFVGDFDQEVGRPRIAPVGGIAAQLELADDTVPRMLNDTPGTVDHQPVDRVAATVLMNRREVVLAPPPREPGATDPIGKGKQKRNAVARRVGAGRGEFGVGVEHVDHRSPRRQAQHEAGEARLGKNAGQCPGPGVGQRQWVHREIIGPTAE
jgi:hypothetical protein